MSKILFMIAPIISAFFAFITVPFIAWFHPQETLATYTLILTTINLLVVFLTFGLDHSFIREFHETNKKELLFLKSLLFSVVLASFILFVICFFWNHEISHFLGGTNLSSLMLFTSVVLFFIFNRFYLLYFRMEDNGQGYLLTIGLPKVVFLCCILIISYIDLNNTSFFILTLSLFISYLINLFWFLKKTITFKKTITSRELLNSKGFSKQLLYGAPLVFSGLIALGVVSVDKYLLSYLIGKDSLAIYALAISFSSVGSVISSMFTVLWVPAAFKWSSEGAFEEKINDIMQLLLCGAIIFWVSIINLSSLIVYMVPEQYSVIQFIIPVCFLVHIFYCLSEIPAVTLNIKRKPIVNLYASIISFTCCLVLNYMLIPLFKEAGAAISTAISMGLFMVLRFEFSTFLGFDIQRIRVYLSSLFMLLISCLLVYSEEEFVLYIKVGSLFFLLLTLVMNKTLLVKFIKSISLLMKSKNYVCKS